MSTPDHPTGPLFGDLAGAGQIVNSEVAKRTYDDALSPTMRELGGLGGDTLKAFRLFTAPIQLVAAYQDRFSAFCNRVRQRVPEEQQCEAPAEIGRPVMEAFASTSDDGPLMSMFEELMAKAIDKREAGKLSPSFPNIIRGLSPLQAKLIASLINTQQITDDLINTYENRIVQRLYANFDFADFGDHAHHLTISQDLKEKNILLITRDLSVDLPKVYPDLEVPEGHELRRTSFQLSMFGRWFASACVGKATSPITPG
ncbi:MAG: Abi-alpha family protein [Sulfuritalea sp.]|nr:Abi-alpha family protein [Sulfuritalea sp.]